MHRSHRISGALERNLIGQETNERVTDPRLTALLTFAPIPLVMPLGPNIRNFIDTSDPFVLRSLEVSAFIHSFNVRLIQLIQAFNGAKGRLHNQEDCRSAQFA